MQAYTAPPGEAWGVGAGPFIFRGKPPFVSGEIELINHSDEKVKVRTIATVPTRAHRSASGAADRPAIGEVQLAARLRPGSRERVRAHIAVDPYTPPGTYTMELDVGGQRERVVVHVFEKHAVTLAPNKIELRGAPLDVLTHPLIITNRGNVAHSVPEVALLHLEERDWFGRSLVYALRESDEDEGHQRYLDRVVREMRATDVPPIRVVVQGDARDVQPGETVEVQLELTLPEKLIKGRSYLRTIPFMSASLTIQLECNGAVNSNKRRPR